MNKKYNIYLKTQMPIPFYEICLIHQPILEDVIKYDLELFDNLLIPFSITKDIMPLTDEDKAKITNFDIIMANEELAYSLNNSLSFFTKKTPQFSTEGIHFVESKGFINAENFDEFAEIILEMCAKSRPAPLPQFKNERQKDIWMKLEEGRARERKRNELKLEDILNIVQYGNNMFIPKSEFMKFTLWEVMNCYKSKMGISNYEDSFSIYLQSGEKSLIDKHWSDLIKINHSNVK